MTRDARSSALADDRLAEWEARGYFLVPGFLPPDDCGLLLAAAGAMVTGAGGGVVVRFEHNLPEALPPHQRVSKLYRFHRHEPFRSLSTSSRLLSLVEPLVGGDTDVFLSQVIWKVPGALGQPWHQDASIFPFEPARPVVAAWMALTPVDEADSCLRVVPGSHCTEVAPHSFDPRSPTEGRYLAMTDQEVAGWEPLVMAAGDLVVFDSQLVHSSGDNTTGVPRAALCFHYAAAGTIDRTTERFGVSPFNDWMPTPRANRSSW